MLNWQGDKYNSYVQTKLFVIYCRWNGMYYWFSVDFGDETVLYDSGFVSMELAQDTAIREYKNMLLEELRFIDA